MYFFFGETIRFVYEVGEAAFEGGGSRPRFFGGDGEFFVSASEVAERAGGEAAFAFGLRR
jgi:hypothetical protein